MTDIYSFTEDNKEIINLLKQVVTVKYGNYKKVKRFITDNVNTYLLNWLGSGSVEIF